MTKLGQLQAATHVNYDCVNKKHPWLLIEPCQTGVATLNIKYYLRRFEVGFREMK